MGEAKRRLEAQLRQMAQGDVPIVGQRKDVPIIDETFNGGPAAPMPLQMPGGKMELHVGLTVLDQYALVALREYIRRGLGMVKVEGTEGEMRLDTDVLARAVIGTALSCVSLRDKSAWITAEQPADELAAKRAEQQATAPDAPAPEGSAT